MTPFASQETIRVLLAAVVENSDQCDGCGRLYQTPERRDPNTDHWAWRRCPSTTCVRYRKTVLYSREWEQRMREALAGREPVPLASSPSPVLNTERNRAIEDCAAWLRTQLPSTRSDLACLFPSSRSSRFGRDPERRPEVPEDAHKAATIMEAEVKAMDVPEAANLRTCIVKLLGLIDKPDPQVVREAMVLLGNEIYLRHDSPVRARLRQALAENFHAILDDLEPIVESAIAGRLSGRGAP